MSGTTNEAASLILQGAFATRRFQTVETFAAESIKAVWSALINANEDTQRIKIQPFFRNKGNFWKDTHTIRLLT